MWLFTAFKAASQDTFLADVGIDGAQADKEASSVAVSADGRWIAFQSSALNLVPGTTNPGHIFVKDTLTGAIDIGSRSSSGAKGNAPSSNPFLSADGRYVVFESMATNLVPGDFNVAKDIFLRDLVLGTTQRVSVAQDGSESDRNSDEPTVSDDGRFVTFFTDATLGFANDTNGTYDVFVRDTGLGTTRQVSLTPAGVTGSSSSQSAMVSGDGGFVAFESLSKDILPGQAFNQRQIYRRDLGTDATERVSVDSAGILANATSEEPGISSDGRFVAFVSLATNLAAGDLLFQNDVFVRDMALGITERISSTPTGAEPSGECLLDPSSGRSISRDGRHVVYSSGATNILPELSTSKSRIFVKDRTTGITSFRSTTWKGTTSENNCFNGVVSDDATRVAFTSSGTDLVPIDNNGAIDVFVHAIDFTSWIDLGGALPGSQGPPVLTGAGPLVPGTSGALLLGQVPATSAGLLLVALTTQPTPFKGGNLLAVPPASIWPLVADGAGAVQWTFVWPPGFPSGLPFYLQAIFPDAGAIHGVSISNALQGTQP